MVLLLHLYLTVGKTTALTIRTFVVIVDANIAPWGYGQNAGMEALRFFISGEDRRCNLRPYEAQECWSEFFWMKTAGACKGSRKSMLIIQRQ